MPKFFADAATQDTRGDRGTTTRRKGTRTVRGCEGAWIAQMKEEMGQPKWFKVYSRMTKWDAKSQTWKNYDSHDGRFTKQEDAESYIAVTTAPDRVVAPQQDGRSYCTGKFIKVTNRRF
jgi:hypothetical protein